MNREEILSHDSLDTDSTRALSTLQARRFSCRKYLDKPVSAKLLERIFELAQLSASWCNAQPWQVLVTRGDGTERFRELLYKTASNDALAANSPEQRSSEQRRSDLPMPAGYTGCRKERRRKQGRQLYNAMGILGDRDSSARFTLENFRFFGAPHAAVFTSARELGSYGVLDAGIYLGNLMLVMESFGIASIPQAALAVYGDVVRQFFQIPDDRDIICGMSFGYADHKNPVNGYRTDRADLSEIVTWYD